MYWGRWCLQRASRGSAVGGRRIGGYQIIGMKILLSQCDFLYGRDARALGLIHKRADEERENAPDLLSKRCLTNVRITMGRKLALNASCVCASHHGALAAQRQSLHVCLVCIMLADAGADAAHAYASSAAMEEPPQLWHVLLRRPCSEMEESPQLFHSLFMLSCSQMVEPSQLLHVCLWRPCSRMPLYPHSRHKYFLAIASRLISVLHRSPNLSKGPCPLDLLVVGQSRRVLFSTPSICSLLLRSSPLFPLGSRRAPHLKWGLLRGGNLS
jgi:hypothetical protein